jgi:hypothetical protein
LLADRIWHLTEATCIKAFTASEPQAKKHAHGALFKLYQAWLAEPLSAVAKTSSTPYSAGSEITSSQNGYGRKKTF